MGLHNFARMTSATTGTGTITLGSADSGFRTFADAGVLDGEIVSYFIRDGANSEIGIGVYTSSGTTLSRSVLTSTNSNNAINLSGQAEIFITSSANDLHQGWQPYALPSPVSIDTSGQTTSYNSGATATIPVHLEAPMLLQAVSVVNTDTTSERSWGWDLYVQDTNSGNTSENTLRRVATGASNDTFTASALSLRTIAADSAPVFIPRGLYWLAVQNRHATNTFGARVTGRSINNAALRLNQSLVTTIPNGSTLDLVTGAWLKASSIVLCTLQGRVFGQTTAF